MGSGASDRMSDPTHGRIDPDIQRMVDEWGPKSVGVRVALENTAQTRRLERFGPCPSRSPESGVPCRYGDVASAHEAGHASLLEGGVRAVWPTTAEDHERWGTVVDEHWREDPPEETARLWPLGALACLAIAVCAVGYFVGRWLGHG